MEEFTSIIFQNFWGIRKYSFSRIIELISEENSINFLHMKKNKIIGII